MQSTATVALNTCELSDDVTKTVIISNLCEETKMYT